MKREWLEAVKDPLFRTCLNKCAEDKEYVKEFDRLNHSNLLRRGPAMIKLVDDVSGKTREDILKFIQCVYESVYLPLKKQRDEAAAKKEGEDGG